jgi:acid phosphatase type 7
MGDTISRRQAIGMMTATLALPLLGCREDLLAPQQTASLASADAGPVTLIGAGDPHAKLNNGNAERVGRMIKTMLDSNPGARAFAVGDVTAHGAQEEFELYDRAWGAFKGVTDFQIGNHDFLTDSTGTPYYDYAGEAAGPRGKGYYAKTYGSWRGYYLNSMRGLAEQTAWLQADLPQWAGYHIYAMWHHPLFASVCAHHGRAMTFPKQVGPWWQLLQDHGAEFVVSGHVHRYERFPRMLRDGTVSAAGIRQFVLGTGGAKPMEILSVDPRSQRQFVTRGVTKFVLHADRYEWQFTDVAGVMRDSGSQACRVSAA